MKKVIFALALLAAFSFSAKAQEFTPYPYVQLQGGVSYDFGNASFPKLLSPAAQVAVGYQFVDCWSVRFAVNGWQAKHTSEQTNTLYGYKFVQPNVDLVLDWGAGLFGWRPDRPATVYTFFGLGGAIGLENGKAQDLAAAGESFPLLWQPVKAFWNTRSGIGTDIRLTDRMALNFEFDAQFYPESFNSRYNPKVAAGPDFHFALLGGLKFNLGWRPKKAKPVVAPATYQPRNEPKKQEPKKEYREEPAKQQPAEQPEQVAMRRVPCRIGCHLVLLQKRMRDDVAVIPGEGAGVFLRLFWGHAEQGRVFQHARLDAPRVMGSYISRQDATRRMAGHQVIASDDLTRERNQRIAVCRACVQRRVVRRLAMPEAVDGEHVIAL